MQLHCLDPECAKNGGTCHSDGWQKHCRRILTTTGTDILVQIKLKCKKCGGKGRACKAAARHEMH